MSSFRYRDEDSLSQSLGYVIAGAAAGFAVGVAVAHKLGGVRGITNKVREHFGQTPLADVDHDDAFDADEYEEEFDEVGIGAHAGAETSRSGDTLATTANITVEEEQLEQNVLEAFRNDPILCERPVDIGAISDGIVELTGWVNEEEEAAHAVTVARGVPGVATVVNRLAVRPDEERFEEFAQRYANGDPALTERHWEGQQVGTGKRRQGNSAEPDRHADPRPQLEERWTREDAAIAEAADDVPGSARPRHGRTGKRGGRTDGSPVAPTGVPKSDHVAEPERAPGRVD